MLSLAYFHIRKYNGRGLGKHFLFLIMKVGFVLGVVADFSSVTGHISTGGVTPWIKNSDSLDVVIGTQRNSISIGSQVFLHLAILRAIN